ncbi:MAG TPA: hypothetical protein DCW90_17315 [Lachnospiraceae bacterium]|nr:hypothetical protein [uncultured Lachnoclostridium sp.]HAU87174.1 hypothetical protein [Lachnospiraceae bacterium]
MKVKYFLRGLGIGILVTTLLLFVGARKNVQSSMTDEQIIQRAKQLGMLTKDEVSDYKMDQNLDNLKETINASTSPEPSKKPEVSEKAEPSERKTDASVSPVKKPEKKKDKEKKEAETISIKIEPGMVSQSIARYLYQKNVIGSATDFNKYMQEHDVAEKLRAGEFEIPKDATYEEIVEIIT